MPGKELRRRWLEDSLCMLQLAQIGSLKNVQWYFERIRSVRNRVTEHLLSSREKVQPVVCNRENHNLSLPHKDVWSILAVFCCSEFSPTSYKKPWMYSLSSYLKYKALKIKRKYLESKEEETFSNQQLLRRHCLFNTTRQNTLLMENVRPKRL